MCIHTHAHISTEAKLARARAGVSGGRQGVNMVGVNMVLAEYHQIKHAISNDVTCRCFDGILLKPCLLQPCFHVAGGGRRGPRGSPG